MVRLCRKILKKNVGGWWNCDTMQSQNEIQEYDHGGNFPRKICL